MLLSSRLQVVPQFPVPPYSRQTAPFVWACGMHGPKIKSPFRLSISKSQICWIQMPGCHTLITASSKLSQKQQSSTMLCKIIHWIAIYLCPYRQTPNQTKSTGPTVWLFCTDISKCTLVYCCMANSKLWWLMNVGFPKQQLIANLHPEFWISH